MRLLRSAALRFPASAAEDDFVYSRWDRLNGRYYLTADMCWVMAVRLRSRSIAPCSARPRGVTAAAHRVIRKSAAADVPLWRWLVRAARS